MGQPQHDFILDTMLQNESMSSLAPQGPANGCAPSRVRRFAEQAFAGPSACHVVLACKSYLYVQAEFWASPDAK